MKIKYRYIGLYYEEAQVFDSSFDDFFNSAKSLRYKDKNPLFIYREDDESKEWRKTFQREGNQFIEEGRIIEKEKDC